jgi:hypothetical protein
MKLIFLIFVSISIQAQDIPYNKAQFKTSHNSYAEDISIIDLITIHKFQAIELDLHTSKLFDQTITKDWYIYHHSLDLKSNTRTFSEALKKLSQYSNNNKGHEVITVFLDSDKFDRSHSIEDFNNLLLKNFSNKLFTPKQMKSKRPKLNRLKGKFIFVLTSGDLEKYITSKKQLAFVASKPNRIIEGSTFMNSKFTDNKEWIKDQKSQNKLLRFYHLDEKEIPKAKELGVNFIAIDF